MPQIPQIVAVPQMRAPEAAHLSENSPVGAAMQQAGEKVSEIGEKEARIAYHQQETADGLQLQKGINAGLQLNQNAFNKVQGLPADQMVSAYKQAVDTTPILNDPQFARVKDKLALHLEMVNMRGLGEANKHAIIAKHSEIVGQLDVQNNHATQLAANATDALSYNTAVAGGHATIEHALATGALTYEQATKRHLAFDQQVQFLSNANMAQNPAYAGQMLQRGPMGLPNSDKLTPEHKEQVLNMAKATVEGPMQATHLAHAIAKNQVITQLDDLVARHSPGLQGAVMTAWNGGMIDEPEFKQYLHMKPPRDPRDRPQDDATLIAQVNKQIADDPNSLSSADLSAMRATVDSPGLGPSYKDVYANWVDSKKAVNTAVGAEYLRAKREIQNATKPGIVDINDKQKEKSQTAVDDFHAQFKEGFKSVKDLHAARDEVIKTYARKKMAPAKPPPPLPPVPEGYLTAAYKWMAGRAKATNYDPSGGSE